MSRTPNPPAIQPAHSFSAMKGSTGESVHSAAVQALMEPGPPHTLEFPPKALAKAHHSRKSAWTSVLPGLGLLLILTGTLLAFMVAPPYSLLLIVPSAPAILGGWLRRPILQKIGVGFMALMSIGWLVLAISYCPRQLLTQREDR